jgi:serine/threonine protein kinase
VKRPIAVNNNDADFKKVAQCLTDRDKALLATGKYKTMYYFGELHSTKDRMSGNVGILAPGQHIAFRYKIVETTIHTESEVMIIVQDMAAGGKKMTMRMAKPGHNTASFVQDYHIYKNYPSFNYPKPFSQVAIPVDWIEFDERNILVYSQAIKKTLATHLLRRSGSTCGYQELRTRAWMIMNGTMALASKGITHCNLTPEDIWIGERNQLLVGNMRHAVTGQESKCKGQHEYMAPEHDEHPHAPLTIETGSRSDVYSLGVLFMKYYAGRNFDPALFAKYIRQRESDYASEYLKQVIERSCSSISSNQKEEFSKLINMMLTKYPRRRRDLAQIARMPFFKQVGAF